MQRLMHIARPMNCCSLVAFTWLRQQHVAFFSTSQRLHVAHSTLVRNKVEPVPSYLRSTNEWRKAHGGSRLSPSQALRQHSHALRKTTSPSRTIVSCHINAIRLPSAVPLFTWIQCACWKCDMMRYFSHLCKRHYLALLENCFWGPRRKAPANL